MDDVWEGYTKEELRQLDDEWEEFYEYLKENNGEYETGRE